MLGKCRKSIISALEPFSAVLGLLGDLGDVPRPRDLPGVPPACRAASRHPPATRRGSPPSIPPSELNPDPTCHPLWAQPSLGL